jgi:hypothetical protein
MVWLSPCPRKPGYVEATCSAFSAAKIVSNTAIINHPYLVRRMINTLST